MKKIKWFVSVTIFCLSCSSAIAQEMERVSRTIFKFSPQHFVRKALKVGVERFNNNHSGSVAIFVTGVLNNNEDNYHFRDQYDGLAGELQLRKYISAMKLYTSKKDNTYHRGIYIAAYAQAGSYSGTFIDRLNNGYMYSENIKNYGVGFFIGYQQTIWQVVFVEVFIGGGIQSGDPGRSGTFSPRYFAGPWIIEPDYKGVLPKIGLNIGTAL